MTNIAELMREAASCLNPKLFPDLRAELREAAAELERAEPVHIIFDGPPSHESGRFVEVETPDGKGINVGEWVERDDGLWALVIPTSAVPIVQERVCECQYGSDFPCNPTCQQSGYCYTKTASSPRPPTSDNAMRYATEAEYWKQRAQIPPTSAVPEHQSIKAICTSFFRWWYNAPGTNTEQGFDEWAAGEGRVMLSAAPQPGDK